MSTPTAQSRNHVLQCQLGDTRAELCQLATRPLEYLHEIRVGREHGESYIETMLAQERSLMRQLGSGHEREVWEREKEASKALNYAASFLRGIACQPSAELGEALRLNCRIISKGVAIALR